MDWNADDLRASLGKKPNGFNQKREDQLLDIFQPFCPVDDVLMQRLPILHRPAVVVDDIGRILAWILPGILSKVRQVSEYNCSTEAVLRLIFLQQEILGATEHLKCKLQIDDSKLANPRHSHVGWRTGPAFFREGCDWPAGTWLATPAGYAIGHQVGHHTDRRPCLRLICWYP